MRYLQCGVMRHRMYRLPLSACHHAHAHQRRPVSFATRRSSDLIASHTDGAVTEDVSLVAGNLNTSGSITFTDVDTADTHTADIPTPPLSSRPRCTPDNTTSDKGNDGTHVWSFQVADGATDYVQD